MMYFVLNNIRSSWNVGSIMRSCDALGFELILVGYTPKPVGPTLPLIKKTAIGAENTVKWYSFDHYHDVLSTYPNGKHLAIEIDSKSTDIFEYLKTSVISAKEDIFLWFGNEISGLDETLLAYTSHILHLPMQGKKESLNVSNAATTVGYLILEHIAK
jgi:23S rRNA (guanosine2251-2'-O)-methyltransferase